MVNSLDAVVEIERLEWSDNVTEFRGSVGAAAMGSSLDAWWSGASSASSATSTRSNSLPTLDRLENEKSWWCCVDEAKLYGVDVVVVVVVVGDVALCHDSPAISSSRASRRARFFAMSSDVSKEVCGRANDDHGRTDWSLTILPLGTGGRGISGGGERGMGVRDEILLNEDLDGFLDNEIVRSGIATAVVGEGPKVPNISDSNVSVMETANGGPWDS